ASCRAVGSWGCGVNSRTKSVCISVVCLCGLILALICTFVPALYGQAITATLSGRIVDTTGGSVSKARVTVSNMATGLTRTAQSSDTGEYTIPALPAGEYTAAVEFAGFGKQTKNITLQVGQLAELDFTVTPGAREEKIVVAATSELQEPTRT